MEKLEKIAEKSAQWLGSVWSIIIHTLGFVLILLSHYLFKMSWNGVLLVLTTLVSLEAIYFSIFIQMTVNKHGRHLKKHTEHLDKLSINKEQL